MLTREYADHLEFLNVRPKLETTRRCLESRSTYNRLLKSREGGNVLYLIQLYTRLKSIRSRLKNS